MADEAPDWSQSEIEKFLQRWLPRERFLQRWRRRESEMGYAELLRRLNFLSPEIVERAEATD